jgi:MFS family permease
MTVTLTTAIENTTKTPTMERHALASIIVLICINVMDSVMGAIVGPTLIFYVNDLGGSKNEYGMMLSIVFLASIIMIPVYGSWVDSNGNKYIVPYMTSFGLGIVSSVIYFLAILLPKGPIAVYSLMFSRFLDGASIAGRTLAYSWVASTILPDQQRNILIFLSMSRTLGMVVGPFVNMLVSKIDTEFQIFGLKIPVDPNNSIGLLMLGGEIVLVILTLLFLQEPPEKEFQKNRKSEMSGAKTEAKGVLYALSHFDIFFPVFIMFVSLANFSL